MPASKPTASIGVALLVLVASVQTVCCRPAVGGKDGGSSNYRHMTAKDGTPLPLTMNNPKFLNWQMKTGPDFYSELPSWEEQQREQHPVDSPELWGPFVYTEEEERALEKGLAVNESEWNAKAGGIGGRPRPRYCVLDEAWRASEHPDQDFSPEGFRRTVRGVQRQGRLHDFLVYDRYQSPRGHDVLTGRPLTMDLPSSYTCPVLRTYAKADWSCSINKNGGQRNGLLKMDTPFKDVRTMRLSLSTLLESPGPEDIPDFEEIFFHRGPSFPYCHEGSCDCDRVFRDHYNRYPAVCDVRKLLRALEPYGEEYARQQIVLVFALYDKPWFTSSNLSVIDGKGFASLSYELPTQLVQSNWFGRIFHEAKRDRLPGIETYPKMFSAEYMEGREKLFVEAMLEADIESKMGVLAAWGQRHESTAYTNESVVLNEFAKRHSWVDHRAIPPEHYWAELAKYRFLVGLVQPSQTLPKADGGLELLFAIVTADSSMPGGRPRVPPLRVGSMVKVRLLFVGALQIAPRGNGLQAPKFLEAVAVMTIPITKRYACFEDLQMYGFPLVVVDDWEEITPKALAYWWRKLSPRLEEARWLIGHFGLNSLLYGNCA